MCHQGELPQGRCSGDGSVLQRASTFRELHGADWFLGDVAGASKGHAMGFLNPKRRIWTTVGFLESHQRVLRQVGMWLDSCFGKSA